MDLQVKAENDIGEGTGLRQRYLYKLSNVGSPSS